MQLTLTAAGAGEFAPPPVIAVISGPTLKHRAYQWSTRSDRPFVKLNPVY